MILPAVLLWDGAPPSAAVAAALRARVGHQMQGLAEVELESLPT